MSQPQPSDRPEEGHLPGACSATPNRASEPGLLDRHRRNRMVYSGSTVVRR